MHFRSSLLGLILCGAFVFVFAQTPSSVFWKELALAMPRRVVFHNKSAGDPQTLLEDDKDPMLTLEPDYLDCRSDTDPAGDLGKSCSLDFLCVYILISGKNTEASMHMFNKHLLMTLIQ